MVSNLALWTKFPELTALDWKKETAVLRQQSFITKIVINLSKKEKNKNCSIKNQFNNHDCKFHALTLENESENVLGNFVLLSSGKYFFRSALWLHESEKNCLLCQRYTIDFEYFEIWNMLLWIIIYMIIIIWLLWIRMRLRNLLKVLQDN